jgi:hypothetical protein
MAPDRALSQVSHRFPALRLRSGRSPGNRLSAIAISGSPFKTIHRIVLSAAAVAAADHASPLFKKARIPRRCDRDRQDWFCGEVYGIISTTVAQAACELPKSTVATKVATKATTKRAAQSSHDGVSSGHAKPRH